ncbi:hypothetical protein D027_0148 [Vibrio parahaemolyticus 861]|nr:conserved hypothetical protein [Vibrio parahaemolyticus AN-5034]EQM37624.1 hypothetical protein D025_1860 [Vibrio parahaemolyticus 949]ETS23445.1 hypothetical protein D033_0892 [Vibrio parahaemolyticus B-265]ETX59905.1 hypothetical protein D038_0147 [Vibrio parahaemolyticus IDH02189]ETY61187.1 hypothetical protein D039_0528 [Vibrio parahaemolyticus EKP-028]EUC26518.1 hypothetical protein D027_0148 [Vibrio parahaemolyticus 861]EWM40026.1 hypothetical protein D043_0158 [Vibrio parahaemolytic
MEITLFCVQVDGSKSEQFDDKNGECLYRIWGSSPDLID